MSKLNIFLGALALFFIPVMAIGAVSNFQQGNYVIMTLQGLLVFLNINSVSRAYDRYKAGY